jgi:hypothetical protein
MMKDKGRSEIRLSRVHVEQICAMLHQAAWEVDAAAKREELAQEWGKAGQDAATRANVAAWHAREKARECEARLAAVAVALAPFLAPAPPEKDGALREGDAP